MRKPRLMRAAQSHLLVREQGTAHPLSVWLHGPCSWPRGDRRQESAYSLRNAFHAAYQAVPVTPVSQMPSFHSGTCRNRGSEGSVPCCEPWDQEAARLGAEPGPASQPTTHTHTCTHTHTHTHTHACTHLHTCMYTHLHAHTYTHVHTYTHACVNIHVLVYTHAHARICVQYIHMQPYIRVHVCVCTHTHTHTICPHPLSELAVFSSITKDS